MKEKWNCSCSAKKNSVFPTRDQIVSVMSDVNEEQNIEVAFMDPKEDSKFEEGVPAEDLKHVFYMASQNETMKGEVKTQKEPLEKVMQQTNLKIMMKMEPAQCFKQNKQETKEDSETELKD